MTPIAMTTTQATEFRAAGTDLSERRRSGVSAGPLIDISATSDMIGMHWGTDGSLSMAPSPPLPPSLPMRASPPPIRALPQPRKA